MSLLQSPEGSRGRALADDSLQEKGQENGEQVSTSPPPSKNVPVQGSSSEPFHQHGLSAPATKVIAAKTACQSSPTTTRFHPLLYSTKSMATGNRYYRRSPSPPSQDSFAGPISQDPAEQYLVSAKQFHVPLSDLGDTPTQEVIYSPSDPGATLPDPSSQDKEVFEVAIRKYEAQKANRAISDGGANVLAAATPSNYSGNSQDDFSFQNSGHKSDAQEAGFEFDGSSSYDKMLDRGLADAPEPTPDLTQAQRIQPTMVDDPVGVGTSAVDDIVATPPQSSKQSSPPFDWIAPSPSTAVASSNPRSLLRMVHPKNHYRIAKMRNLAGDVEPPPSVIMGAETQPCHTDGSNYSHVPPQARPTSRQDVINFGQLKHNVGREDEHDQDALDIIPDSEPLRAETSSQIPGHRQTMRRSPPKKPFRLISPMSELGSEDPVHGSLEVEESEPDIPLALELPSRNAKKPVAHTGDMSAHGRKTNSSSSIVPAKALLPTIEKQTRRPPPSTTKATRANCSKMESAEIPTSLPEQDLQNQASSTMQPPGKEGGRLPLAERSRAHHDFTCPPATRLVAGKKRSHSSDTDSSNDLSHLSTQNERDIRLRSQKEEEEETDPADDRDSDFPPPPPKPDALRKKRRRTENVNPTRGMSKVTTSTRTKRSETPIIVTRSVKKFRSGLSSTRGLSTEPATRVFALWKQDGHYYSGVIYSRGLKTKFLVKFDDGTEDEVELKNMRRRELLVGDRVILIQDNIKSLVRNVSHADPLSSFTLEVDDGEEVTAIQATCSEIRIANRTVQSQWKERMVIAEDIVTVVKPKPLIDTTPSKQSIVSTISGKPQRELAKTGFVVTISPKNDDPVQTKEDAMRAIKQHGGMVIEDWSSVFTMEGKHSQSNKRWIATSQDFRWKPEVNLDRVFLLSDDAHQKPKFLLALALGIPCLSFEWLTREANFSLDWQPFLLPAGYSDTLGARVSQLVDLDWGNCTEHLTDIMANQVPIKLFSRKTVLCIGSDLVPPPPRKNASDEASRYVPWIILCMGAAKVEAVIDVKQVPLGHMQTFDYIIVKERGVLGSVRPGNNVTVGDVGWVKECLVSSRLSSPVLD